jgi:transcription factor AP-4
MDDIIRSIYGNVQNLSDESDSMNDSFVGVVVPLTAVPATVSESSDEGIGSMSPEPVAIITNTSVISGLDNGDPSREMIELRVQLDRERRLRMHLEDQVWYFRTALHLRFEMGIQNILYHVRITHFSFSMIAV